MVGVRGSMAARGRTAPARVHSCRGSTMGMRAACSTAAILAVVALGFAGCGGRAGRADRPMEPEPGDRDRDLAGSDTCATCHEQEARLWRYGAHRTVACERCHGPGAAHARVESGPRPRVSLGNIDLCLGCHQGGADDTGKKIATIESFEAHLRTLERDHRIKLDRQKSGTDCVYCHDPHLLE
jgi:hypothetical protein